MEQTTDPLQRWRELSLLKESALVVIDGLPKVQSWFGALVRRMLGKTLPAKTAFLQDLSLCYPPDTCRELEQRFLVTEQLTAHQVHRCLHRLAEFDRTEPLELNQQTLCLLVGCGALPRIPSTAQLEQILDQLQLHLANSEASLTRSSLIEALQTVVGQLEENDERWRAQIDGSLPSVGLAHITEAALSRLPELAITQNNREELYQRVHQAAVRNLPGEKYLTRQILVDLVSKALLDLAKQQTTVRFTDPPASGKTAKILRLQPLSCDSMEHPLTDRLARLEDKNPQ